MALDTSGNQAVDFAWGNFPMQPNADRAESITPVEAVLAYADEKGGKQRFTSVYATLPDVFVVGATVEVTGFSNPKLNGLFTIGQLTGPAEFATTAAYVATEYSSSPGGNQKATIDPSLNTGGGTGDYNWSKTTKKKSLPLDPALDGHAIVDLGWNGYPGYTPGVNVPPFEPINLQSLVGGYFWLNSAKYDMQGSNTQYYDGNQFTFRIDDVAQNFAIPEDRDAFYAKVNNNELNGQTLVYSNINTGYGDLANSNENHQIIASWLSFNVAYETYDLWLKTAPVTVNETQLVGYSSNSSLPFGATFAITAKQSGWGTPIEIAKVTDTNGINVEMQFDWMNYEHAWKLPTTLLTPAQVSTLLDTSTVGKFLATSNIQIDPSHMSAGVLASWCDQINAVDLYTDGYGVEYVRVYFTARDESYMQESLTLAGEKFMLL